MRVRVRVKFRVRVGFRVGGWDQAAQQSPTPSNPTCRQCTPTGRNGGATWCQGTAVTSVRNQHSLCLWSSSQDQIRLSGSFRSARGSRRQRRQSNRWGGHIDTHLNLLRPHVGERRGQQVGCELVHEGGVVWERASAASRHVPQRRLSQRQTCVCILPHGTLGFWVRASARRAQSCSTEAPAAEADSYAACWLADKQHHRPAQRQPCQSYPTKVAVIANCRRRQPLLRTTTVANISA